MTLRQGHLSDYFKGVGAKRLAAVDTQDAGSNQHEVTGSRVFRDLLGDDERKMARRGGTDNRFDARFIWLGGEQESIADEGRISWYDSRKMQAHRAAEWRLYYQGNAVTELMKPGDALFIAQHANGTLLFIVAPGHSTIERQLLWLFDLPDIHAGNFVVSDLDALKASGELDFAARFILEEIGEELHDDPTGAIDDLIAQFGGKFPKTLALADLARSSLPHVNFRDDPDLALVSWLEREEQIFRRLERQAVSARLSEGFYNAGTADVDGFLSFSKSVQNRRKARMGLSLEHHLEHIFKGLGLLHARGARTEGNARPDFLFPGQEEYLSPTFDPGKLLMLGAKSTCKDRWRQVLAEASRIPRKHLLTLEPGISKNQTDQMQEHSLQLVLPRSIHKTYLPDQQAWLMSLGEFIGLAERLQR
jgi:hypothetical protein